MNDLIKETRIKETKELIISWHNSLGNLVELKETITIIDGKEINKTVELKGINCSRLEMKKITDYIKQIGVDNYINILFQDIELHKLLS